MIVHSNQKFDADSEYLIVFLYYSNSSGVTNVVTETNTKKRERWSRSGLAISYDSVFDADSEYLLVF